MLYVSPTYPTAKLEGDVAITAGEREQETFRQLHCSVSVAVQTKCVGAGNAC